MNSTNLVRHYDALTPWERLPLIVAAAGRNDEVESSRLARSAPRAAFRVADFWGLAEGLESLAKQYLLGQLDLAVIYWRVMNVLDQEPLVRQTRPAKQREERLWRTLRTLAFRFVAQADGWKLLCRQMHIDPEIPLRNLPGQESVHHMEETLRAIACTREEALACLRDVVEHERSQDHPVPALRFDTAEDVARSMRERLEEHLAAWS